jgi:hypothetical protein
MDDQVALAMLRSEDGKSKKSRRRMSEWSAEAELLSTVADRIAELIQATVASRGAKPGTFAAAPRPETALDRVREQERIRKHRALVARVLPHIYGDPGAQPPP